LICEPVAADSVQRVVADMPHLLQSLLLTMPTNKALTHAENARLTRARAAG
jgi:hypothetical protein